MQPKISDIQVLSEEKLKVVFAADVPDRVVPISFVGMFGLRVGMTVSPEILDQLAQAEEVMKAKAYAKKACQTSEIPHSKSEIIKLLQLQGFESESIEATVLDLEQSGHVKDQVFARKWVDRRRKSTPRGKRVLRFELRGKGVDTSTIDHVLSEVDESDETESALRISRKHARRYKSLAPHVAKRRLQELLLRRGFGYDIIQRVTATLETEKS
ncbi:MAG: regulatory protein RecX [Candidatus Poribacteria bacterium]|jgi:regulatory protein|nr:regulatory protein RecX [Candidatus Poribacteria bacterium]MDP6748486.1 regulatory protein RecX [Candidatus Poribacteria bacterium]MDP6995058.1 regulatory protein RecX [Candidatus Poribacteria bacterium]